MLNGGEPQLTRELNRALNLEEYQRGEICLRSRPRYVLVELTQGCNLKCPMCRADYIHSKERLMDDGLFEKASQLFATAEMVDLRGWGESLILPDIVDRIQAVSRSGARIRFVTNLAFRRDRVLDALVEYKCYVAVSMDTSDPELFALLRGGASLAQVSRNLDRLMAGRRDSDDGAQVYFTTTVQRPALSGLHRLIEFAAEKGVREIRMFTVTGQDDTFLSLQPSPKQVDEMLSTAASLAKARGVRLVVGSRLGSMPENPSGGPACIHPWAYATVAYDGCVGFCDHLIGPKSSFYHVGNLGENSFEEIWNGAEWVELRREHLARRDPRAAHFEECSWCYGHRYVDFEHLFDPDALNHIKQLAP
ncbi:MAG: SPASM domain-containing protein [Acidobacteriaceae bacterium]|nr:SPASM domain-containing protein [Acidobacteriaceae bacterium]